MSTSNELRVFISSTFRDLQEEREHLIKKIFPEIRALCRERGVTFTEVDLRWGLTDEDVALGQVIRTCLEEVDKCRPYFIGITGDRYGFIPTHLDIYKDPAVLEQYPWVEEAVLEEMSITEMEAHYAVLNPATFPSSARGEGARGGGARFYFRRHRESFDDASDNDAESVRLMAYQQRVRAAGVQIAEFRDASLLGELIYDDLVKIIKRDFADAKPLTPLEQERARHESFSLSRRRAYIPNPAYLKRLNDHAASDDPPLVVYAESGSGKSSLFAFWAEQYRRKNPNAHVVEHYVGIGATSTDHYAVIRHICMEINERFGREEEIPSDPSKLETALGQWLGYADHELAKRGESMVLILDGLNQLQGTALNLRWIPDVIAPSIRLIVSSTVEGTLVELRKRGWTQFGMQALSEAERETIVVRYLAEYHKSLNPVQIKRIAGDYKCGHPLFLKTVLEELRLVGHHEELDAKIASYLEATGTEDLFQRVLERLEEDYNMRAVRDVMSLLSASRNGLDDRELSEISGLARLKIATMMAGLDYHLVRKEGRLTFFHDYLRRAVEKRYLSEQEQEKQQQVHRALAGYFEGAPVTVRTTLDLLHALSSLGQQERVEQTVAEIARFELLWPGVDRYEVLGHLAASEREGIVAAYNAALAAWRSTGVATSERCLDVMGYVAELYELVGAWQAAEQLEEERVGMLRAAGDRRGESQALVLLAWLARNLGRMEEAERVAREAERVARELGDRESIARAVGNRGLVHFSRGEYEEALVCHREQEAIVRELGDRRNTGFAVGHRGGVHWQRGEYEESLACFREQERISRELGDRLNIARSVGNCGLVHSDRGEYEEAFACYRESEQIARELGDRRSIASAIGNRGNVHSDRGEYEESLVCYREQERIARDLAEPRSILLAVGNRGIVHLHRGEHDEALACYRESEQIAREVGDRQSIARVVGNRGIVHSDRGEYEEALACFEQAASEHRALGFRYGLSYWRAGTAQMLVELVEQDGELPEYLTNYLTGITEETPDRSATADKRGQWRIISLRTAREAAEESLLISRELSKPDTLFSSQVLLARIDVAESRADVASQRLNALLEETTDDNQCAELHYWLWKIDGSSKHSDHQAEALRLYQVLLVKTPNHGYRKRIEELQGYGEEF
jgi:tetratricopeptide (TPR) repeat protein